MSQLLDVKVGERYRLSFENSPEGELECEGCPLVMVATCVESDRDYMAFEDDDESMSFFLHCHPGCLKNDQWWDENYWTRLVAVDVEATK